MKKIIIFAIFFCASIISFSEIFTIRDTDVFDFIEEYANSKQFNPRFNYLWTGLITEISENNNNGEVKIIKSRWIQKKELQNITIILKVNNREMLEKIKKIGINNKILFICSVESITKDLEIIGIPVLVKEL